ncbi:hypothetical protein GW17_00016104 [Ensete ventricosum]|nr:hypothetical protein GW17_00016104 [Ensete ventricosum]
MLPLRFPNSGIRAKVFVRKIGFKLRVMRLNRVESFYVFLLHFHSEGSEEGRPATTNPHVGPATHGQAAAKAPCKGAGRLWPGPAHKEGRRRSQGQQPAGAATARWHTRLQRDARKGGRLQGARKGLSLAANPTTSRGGGADRRGGRPLAGWLSAGKGSSGGDGADRARGVRASF